MVTEDYVSFETAKLLKEKGFDEKCHMCWDEVTKTMESADEYATNSELLATYISAPTLQMVMKWLREIQAINIYARGVWKDVEVSAFGDWEPAVVGYEWFIESLTDDTYSKTSTEQFLTYEEACDAAIKHCLEILV